MALSITAMLVTISSTLVEKCLTDITTWMSVHHHLPASFGQVQNLATLTLLLLHCRLHRPSVTTAAQESLNPVATLLIR